MSVCYSMACHQCKTALWVAQDGLSGFTFYSGEPDTMRLFSTFLQDHMGHPLELVSEHTLDDLIEQGYTEIEPSPSEESRRVAQATSMRKAQKTGATK